MDKRASDIFLPGLNQKNYATKKEIVLIQKRLKIQAFCICVLTILLIVFAIIYFLAIPVTPYQSGTSSLFQTSPSNVNDLETKRRIAELEEQLHTNKVSAELMHNVTAGLQAKISALEARLIDAEKIDKRRRVAEKRMHSEDAHQQVMIESVLTENVNLSSRMFHVETVLRGVEIKASSANSDISQLDKKFNYLSSVVARNITNDIESVMNTSVDNAHHVKRLQSDSKGISTTAKHLYEQLVALTARFHDLQNATDTKFKNQSASRARLLGHHRNVLQNSVKALTNRVNEIPHRLDDTERKIDALRTNVTHQQTAFTDSIASLHRSNLATSEIVTSFTRNITDELAKRPTRKNFLALQELLANNSAATQDQISDLKRSSNATTLLLGTLKKNMTSQIARFPVQLAAVDAQISQLNDELLDYKDMTERRIQKLNESDLTLSHGLQQLDRNITATQDQISGLKRSSNATASLLGTLQTSVTKLQTDDQNAFDDSVTYTDQET